MDIRRLAYRLRILDGGAPRTPGFHVSDVIRDLALRGKKLDRKYAATIICGCGSVMDELDFTKHECDQQATAVRKDDMSAERIELGIAWEERLSKHHPEICFHPGEVIVDDIAMTIDGASYEDRDTVSCFGIETGTGAVHEFKLTWKSSRHGVDGEWMWLSQIKSYIHGMEQSGGLPHKTAFLHVYWVNGNYSRRPEDPEDGPNYSIYELKFSTLEIAENWMMIKGHKDRMQGRGHRLNMRKVL